MSELISSSLFSDANLIVYYRLEDVNDSKGSNTLTNTGSVTFAAGKYNNGAVFNGSNLLTSGNIAVGTGAFTMSIWVKVASLPGTYYGLIGGDNDYSGLLMTPTGFSVGKLGVTPGTNVAYTVSLNVWHMVTAVVTSSTSTDIYVNGVYVGASTEVNVMTLGNHLIRLGCGTSVADVPLTGNLDDVGMFSRALTAQEIKQLYLDTGGSFLLNFI